ncbi:MAG: trypsin-like peptidase domain-containing protein [Patescibacteria group bacterium]
MKPITASGVIIDPHGVILTNAHVAQYFLLKDYGSPDFLSCDIRTGSPAKSAYKARLLYIPGEWIEANAGALRESVSLGTGEHDWALLLITEPTGINSTLPSFFDYLSPKTNFKKAILNQPVVLGGYPSELLGGIATAKDLYAVTSVATIKNTYFFHDENSSEIDIFSVGGNIISQGGSSGGGVVDQTDGKLIGLVVTSTQAETTDEKILRATTLDYVSRDLKKLTGETLETLFAKNLPAEVELFAQTDFIRLKRILEKVLSPTN